MGASVRPYSPDNPFAKQQQDSPYSPDNPFAPKPEEKKPSIYETVGSIAKEIVVAPLRSARNAMLAPVKGSGRGPGATGVLSNYGGAEAMGYLPRETDRVGENEQGAVSRREVLQGGVETLANVSAPGIARGVGGTVLKGSAKIGGNVVRAKPIAARVAGSAVAGAVGGAAYSPDNPFVGAGVGAALGAVGGLPGERPGKALLDAAKKTPNVGLSTRDVGDVPPKPFTERLYSRTERAIKSAPFERGTTEQWTAHLSKNSPQFEREWAKMGDVLAEKGRVLSRGEVAAHFDANRIQLGASELGKMPVNQKSPYALPEVLNVAREASRNSDDLLLVLENDGRAYRALTRRFPQLVEREDWAEVVARDVFGGFKNTGANWEGRTVPGPRSDYKELFVHLDKPSQRGQAFREDVHYPDKENVLVSVRRTIRNAGGAKAYFVDEIQSDWHQKGRRQGYDGENFTKGWTAKSGPADPAFGPTWEVRNAEGERVLGIPMASAATPEAAIARAASFGRGESVPDAPFKKTDQWVELGLKRALDDAARTNAKWFVLPTGEQSVLAQGMDDAAGEGVKKFYDDVVPQAFQNYLKSLGGRPNLQRVRVAGVDGENLALQLTPELRQSILRGQRLGAASPYILSQVAGAGAGAATGAAADREDPARGAIAGAATALGITMAGGAAVKRAIQRRPDLRLITPQPMKPEALKVPVKEIDPSEFVNLGKFALDPTGRERLAQQVDEVVKLHGMAPKTPVTWDETRAIAKSIGIDNITEGQVSRRLGGAEMLAIRNVIAENTTQLGRAYKTLETSPLSSEAREELTRSIAAMEAQNHSLLAEFIPARSQTGRDLNSMKILANATLDPAVWFAKAKRLRDGFDPTSDQMRQIGEYIEQGNRLGLIQYMGTLRKSTPTEQVLALRKAGLLTGPTTHVRNTLGNLTMGILETAKDVPATIADNLVSAVTGINTKSFSLKNAASASWKGAKQGVMEARQIMKGIPLDDALRKADVGYEVNIDNKFADAYQKFVFRFMGASDRPFRQAAMMRSLDEQMRISKASAPTNEMVLRAISDAEHAVFQNENVLGTGAQALKRGIRGVSPAAGAAADFVVPFTRTPGAVAGKVVSYSPLGALKTGNDLFKLYRAARGGKDASTIYGLQKQFSESAGRTATGSLAVLLGYDLARRKLMTPGTPPDQSGRDSQSLVGQQSDAVKIGDQWMKVSGISPFGNLLAFGAQLYHGNVPEAAVGIGKTIGEQPFLQGPQEILEGVTREGGAQKILPQALSSAVPSVVGTVARATDPTVRDTRGDFMGPTKAKIPGLSRTLPARVDQLGQPIKRAGNAGTNLLRATIDPFLTRDDKTSDPLRAEILRVGAQITQRSRKKDELPHSYSDRAASEGAGIDSELRRLIASPAYQRADDVERKQMIESRVATERGKATRKLQRPGVR